MSELHYTPPPTPVALKEQLEVANVTVGALSDGDVIPAGTPLDEVLRRILVKALAPTLSLSGTGDKTVEVGTEIAPTLTATYDKRDGGNLNALTINGTDVRPAPFELSPAPFRIGSASDISADVQYQALAEYDDSGATPAGSVSSNVVTYRGERYIFRGTSNAAPTTSADVRALNASPILGVQDGTTFSIDVPDGATSVEFAYPALLGTVAKIEFVGALTSDVTGDYTRTTVAVNGGAGDGSYAVDYYVYRREPSSAYTAATINVTI
ncbi:hypothetical protein [Salisaeta icosahedral phage 1]|uniref:hypothetical protein n=1 Tax=Salisaeta icosahedral phage 1 TaxID=1183239 RepID=UPI00025EA945|nr:hypothetical protein A322_gp56 [Salisaeta icosahedral phage 1]AFJ21511.1 hypothetical protein [Salisaeta icosahedral phage 1]